MGDQSENREADRPDDSAARAGASGQRHKIAAIIELSAGSQKKQMTRTNEKADVR